MTVRLSDFLRGAVALAAMLMRTVETDNTGQAEIIDGDSLRLNGIEMRLKGIDAPEYLQTCQRRDATWDCGRAARAALQRLLVHGPVTCIGAEHDFYGRLLVQCRLRGIDVNAEMVRNGFAFALHSYAAQGKEARDDARGIWAGPFDRPDAWRKAHPRPAR